GPREGMVPGTGQAGKVPHAGLHKEDPRARGRDAIGAPPLMDDAAFGEAPGPSIQRQARLFALLYSAEEVAERSRRIYQEMLAQTPNPGTGTFTPVRGADPGALVGA